MAMPALLAVEDSVLIVIDVQPPFLAKLPEAERGSLLQRIGWLSGVAAWLAVPIIVRAEATAALGGIEAQLVRALPPDTPVHTKLSFGLTGEPSILAAVAATGRHPAVLIGLETALVIFSSLRAGPRASQLAASSRSWTVAASLPSVRSPAAARADRGARARRQSPRR